MYSMGPHPAAPDAIAATTTNDANRDAPALGTSAPDER